METRYFVLDKPQMFTGIENKVISGEFPIIDTFALMDCLLDTMPLMLTEKEDGILDRIEELVYDDIVLSGPHDEHTRSQVFSDVLMLHAELSSILRDSIPEPTLRNVSKIESYLGTRPSLDTEALLIGVSSCPSTRFYQT